jgi:hypothetical protein
MPWADSHLFRQFFADILGNVIANSTADLDAASALKAALYDNSITPALDATAAQSAYAGTGVWTATGTATGSAQVYQAGQWAQGGVTLTGTAISTPASGVTQFTSSNITSGSAATMSNIYGMLIYIDALTTPVADQGLGYWYFGGTAYQVTSGQLTIIPNGNGLFRITS